MVICVKANTRSPRRVRIRQTPWDERRREVFGQIPDYEVAERFGLHPSSLSQIRQGHVTPGTQFVGDTLRLFGGTFDDWFEMDPIEQGSAA